MLSLPLDFAPLSSADGRPSAAELRDAQRGSRPYRHLGEEEIARLERNGNHSSHWDIVMVCDPFDPDRVRNCYFNGLVRIGVMEDDTLEANGRFLSVGIYNSTIQSSDIGDNCAVHNAHLLERVLLGDKVSVLNVGELISFDDAHFGEAGDVDSPKAPWIHVWNESGGRRILPFSSMQPADAWFWAKFRGEQELQQRLLEMTRRSVDWLGPYGMIGDESCVLHSEQVRNVMLGPGTLVKGASRLENVMVNSSIDHPVRLLSGVDLVDSIVNAGAHLDRRSTVHRTILGQDVHLDFGARVDHSVIGDFSAIECGEVRNVICFPHHGQHHNTGFLIAACLEGQSNLAAGATIGSNHNSRQADGEIVANRGFWPGLSTTLKHNSRFASFTLIAKGDYPAEINLRLPFSLISNDILDDSLNVVPAFAFRHNMYSLVRNEQKFQKRAGWQKAESLFETDFLAPDTVEEMFDAMSVLEDWTARAWLTANGEDLESLEDLEIRDKGCSLLLGQHDAVRRLEVKGLRVEKSNRFVRVYRPEQAYRAYREMIQFYAVRTLLKYMKSEGMASLDVLKEIPADSNIWVNVGGQLVRGDDLDALHAGILSGRIGTWERFHAEMQQMRRHYAEHKASHAMSALMRISGWVFEDIEPVFWNIALDRARVIQNRVARLVRESRNKDYENPFRQITFDSHDERNAVVGALDQDAVIKQAVDDAKELVKLIDIYKWSSVKTGSE